MSAVLRPNIVVPGIQGSMLQNIYPIDPTTTWSAFTVAEGKIFAPDFNTLALSDDATSDRTATVVSRPLQLFDIAYATLANGLQGRTTVPTYLFAYDWRYSIVQAANELVRFIERLQAKVLPSLPAWIGDFDFVCHSMGGLVFRQFLGQWNVLKPGVKLPVGRVVFIATPHKGSLDAAQALISGESPIWGGQKEMRKLARTFPSVYELLPLYQNGVACAKRNGIELDLFQEKNWQVNTVEPDLANSGFDVQQVHLTAAERVLRSLPSPTDPPYGVSPADLLVIYGAKPNSTLQVVQVQNDANQWYDFDNATRGVGDDVVLVSSAKLPGVAAVEIQPQDLSYIWQPVQRVMVNSDLHAFLPALDEVHTIVAGFFAGLTGTSMLPINLQREVPSRLS